MEAHFSEKENKRMKLNMIQIEILMVKPSYEILSQNSSLQSPNCDLKSQSFQPYPNFLLVNVIT